MNGLLGGVLGKPTLSTKKTSGGTVPLGYTTYVDDVAPTPSGFLAITNTTQLDAAAYPDLANVIPTEQVAVGTFATTPQTALQNPAANANDQFGNSVAISGDYAVVGAPFSDPAAVPNAGSAYIYVRSGTTWSLQTTLLNPSSTGSDQFGFSVGISGDYAIVGTPGDSPGDVIQAGSVYIYFRSGTTWSLQASLSNPQAETGASFGYAVAISGDYAIVGAYSKDTGISTNTGSVYIYVRSGTSWTLQATIPNPEPEVEDSFGWSVAISGDYAIVGAYFDNPAAVNDAGSAYIYFRSGTTWSLQATIPNPAPADSDRFGSSVSISGDYAIVGASFDSHSGVTSTGSAYIYVRSGTTWSLQATLPNPAPVNGDNFGTSVGISGNYAVVGAPMDDLGSTNAGSAYIYVRSGTTWSLETTIPSPTPSINEYFGWSVAISGGYSIVGANADTGGGAAYTYARPIQPVVTLHPLPAFAGHKTLVKVLP